MTIKVYCSSCKLPANCCATLRKLEFSGQTIEKYTNIKFHENTSSGSRVVACGQTDRRMDMKSVVAFRKFACAPKNNGQKQGIAARRSLGNNAAW
jgi:hypothetical protein